MENLKIIIGNKIRYLRTLYNLSQEEFVEELDINMSRGHISGIERGLHMPSAEFIKVVCTKFNVSTYWLLDIPKSEAAPIDPLFENYNLLSEDAKKIIQDLVSLLLNNT